MAGQVLGSQLPSLIETGYKALALILITPYILGSCIASLESLDRAIQLIA